MSIREVQFPVTLNCSTDLHALVIACGLILMSLESHAETLKARAESLDRDGGGRRVTDPLTGGEVSELDAVRSELKRVEKAIEQRKAEGKAEEDASRLVALKISTDDPPKNVCGACYTEFIPTDAMEGICPACQTKVGYGNGSIAAP